VRRSSGRGDADEVFVDTSALAALVDRSDALHQQARIVEREILVSKRRLVTSEAVLTEFLGFAARPPVRDGALRMIDALAASPAVRVVAATHRGFTEALELYRARPDKEWSLVDCSSILICRARRISRVFTHDRHFEQAGFEAMLR
jgi:predicted nucleic acid-binding protein